MSHLDQRRELLALAGKLKIGQELTDAQRNFLASALVQISAGEDANSAFKLKLKPGEKKTDAIARCRLSLMLHWIACYVQGESHSSEKSISVEAACEEAMTTIVPFAKSIYPGADRHTYDAAYLLRCWHDPAYAHMRSATRGWTEPDFPYWQPPKVNDPK